MGDLVAPVIKYPPARRGWMFIIQPIETKGEITVADIELLRIDAGMT